MKKILLALLVSLAMKAHSQALKIPESVLFSKESSNLQPLAILMIPGTPLVGFCPGFSGGFDEIQIEDSTSNIVKKTGTLVTAIVVDKENKKIIDNLDCSWESSNTNVLTAVPAAKDNKRLFALLPIKEGITKVTVKMGKERSELNVEILNKSGKFSFKVSSSAKGKKNVVNKPLDGIHQPADGLPKPSR
jgi:hypothetical protein